jgi:hypothetical protein
VKEGGIEIHGRETGNKTGLAEGVRLASEDVNGSIATRTGIFTGLAGAGQNLSFAMPQIQRRGTGPLYRLP